MPLPPLTMALAHLNSALEYLGKDENDPVFGPALEHVRVAVQLIEELQPTTPIDASLERKALRRIVDAWSTFRKSATEHRILVGLPPDLCALCVECAIGEAMDEAVDDIIVQRALGFDSPDISG